MPYTFTKLSEVDLFESVNLGLNIYGEQDGNVGRVAPDFSPVAGSGNVITSGAVYDSIDAVESEVAAKQDKLTGTEGQFIMIGADGAAVAQTDFILASSTTDSTKKFKITVDDSGTLTATEIVVEEATE